MLERNLTTQWMRRVLVLVSRLIVVSLPSIWFSVRENGQLEDLEKLHVPKGWQN